MGVIDLTDQPWFVDLGVWAGILTSAGVIIRTGVWPVFRGLWRFIVAAPRIAESVGRVVELLETDLLQRVDKLEAQTADHLLWASVQNKILEANTLQLDATRDRFDALGARITMLEKLIVGPDGYNASPP